MSFNAAITYLQLRILCILFLCILCITIIIQHFKLRKKSHNTFITWLPFSFRNALKIGERLIWFFFCAWILCSIPVSSTEWMQNLLKILCCFQNLCLYSDSPKTTFSNVSLFHYELIFLVVLYMFLVIHFTLLMLVFKYLSCVNIKLIINICSFILTTDAT